jgi:hypothetical protein
VRILLAALLGAGLVGALVIPEPASFGIAALAMLPAFLLGAAKLAMDLIELIRADLIADAALLVALGTAFVTFGSGNRELIVILLAVAFATQVVRLAGARRARPREV